MESVRDKILPDAVASGAFGKAVKFLDFEPESQKGANHYASDVVFGKIILENGQERQTEEFIVVKMQQKGGFMSKVHDLNALFHNEVLFYSEIVPFFKKYDKEGILSAILPKFAYGRATSGGSSEENVIILRNLTKEGFKLTEDQMFVDENHVNLVLEKLAKFHALSYKCQRENAADFQKIISKIKDPLMENDMIPADKLTEYARKGIDPLKKDPKYKDKLDAIYKHSQSALKHLKNSRKSAWQSEKSFPVICHGDLHRNNMMFKYALDGKPKAVVFFDFQIIVYDSPSTDLSVFLMSNTSPEVKRKYWDDFLKNYYNSLSSELVGHTGGPSFDDINLGLRKRGVALYYIMCAFIPVLLSNTSKEDMDRLGEEEDAFKAIADLGDRDHTSEILSEMVKHMIDKDFIFED